MAHRPRLGLALLLCGAAALSVTGCSGASHETSARPSVAFVVANTQLNFSREMSAGFLTGVRDVGGVDAKVTGPDIVDGARQVRLFQTAEHRSPDGVSVFTLSPELFAGPMSQAAQQGVPLIAVDNPPPASSEVSLFVGNDNRLLGKLLADIVIARLPHGATGTVVLGTSSPGVPVLDNRAEGIRAEFARKLPGVKVLGAFDTKQEVGANLAAWEVLVRANPDSLAYLGTGDADGWNLAAIRSRTHATWLAGAFDLDPRAMHAVKDGALLLVSPEHFVKGAIAGRLQATQAKSPSKLPRGWVYVPGLAVTAENIDVIMARQVSTATREAALAPQIDAAISHLAARMRPLAQAG